MGSKDAFCFVLAMKCLNESGSCVCLEYCGMVLWASKVVVLICGQRVYV